MTPFLAAEWRHIVFVNWPVHPALLSSLAPKGTELDSHRGGQVFISLVGFRFPDTRVLGIRVPWHRDFDEVNSRFHGSRATVFRPDRIA